MDDLGFNGTSSRFVGRFEAGSDLTAKKLNDVLAGIESALPRPYIGDGAAVSFSPGGSIITTPQVYIPQQVVTHPFKISAYYDDAEEAFYCDIVAGVVNNIVPSIYVGDTEPLLTDGQSIDMTDAIDPETAEQTVLVYIRTGVGPGNEYPYPYRDPADAYPVAWITNATDPQTDSDEYSYILLGQVVLNAATGEVVRTYQYTTGSLWAARIKVGGTFTASYYYARV
jgi:hypothetical protein